MRPKSWITIVLLVIFGVWGCAQQKPKRIPKRTFDQCSDLAHCVLSIQTAIIDNWARPESARNHMLVTLILKLNDDYTLASIVVSESSGIPEYDESAVKAVKRASPFKELAGLSNQEFKKSFSKFRLYFDPEDLPK